MVFVLNGAGERAVLAATGEPLDKPFALIEGHPDRFDRRVVVYSVRHVGHDDSVSRR